MKNNLSLSENHTNDFTKIRKAFIAFILFIGCFHSLNATTYYSRASGNWNASTSWSTVAIGNATNTGTFPVAGDIVNIGGGFTATVNVTAACASITFTTTATTVTINPGISLTVSGAITLPRASTGNNVLAVGAGILNAASIAYTSSGTSTRHQLTVSTGTVTVTGNITTSTTGASALISFTGAGVLNIGGSLFSAGGGTFTRSTSTVNFNGTAAQTIGAFTYYNLTISGTNTKSLRAATNVSNVLTVSSLSTFALSTFTLGATAAPVSLVMDGGATTGASITGTGALRLGAAATITINDATTGTSGASIACPLTLTSSVTATVADDGTTATDFTISGIVSGAFGIIKAGGGTMELAGLNTYTGTTLVSAGILRATNNTVVASTAGPFGNNASGLQLGGGTIQSNVATFSRPITVTVTGSGLDAYGAARTISSTITLATAGTFNLNIGGTTVASAEGQTLTLSGVISNSTGTLGLTKVGTSSVVVSGTNTFTGGSTLAAGVLSVANVAGLGAAGQAVILNSGTLDLNTNTTVNAYNVTVGGNVTIQSDRSTAGAGITHVLGTLAINAFTLTTDKGTNVSSGTAAVQFGNLTLTADAIANTGTANLIMSGTETGTFKLTKSGAGTLQKTTVGWTLAGAFDVTGGIYDANTQTTTVTGLATISSGTLSASTAAQTFNGGLTVSGGIVTGSTGAVTATDITLSSGTITAPSTTFTVTGNWSNNGGTFTHNSGTVVFNGTTQSLGGSVTTTFNNLTINSGSTTTLAVNTTIAGNLTVTGTYDLSTFTSNRSSGGGTLTVSGTMALGATTGGQTGSNYPTNFTTQTLTGGTVNYNVTAGGQTIYSTPTYSTLTLSNSSGTQTAGGVINCTNLVTTIGGTLDMVTYSLTVTTPSGQGTINTQNTGTTPLPAGKTWAGDINYNAAGNQTVVNGTYSDLSLSNSGNKVFSATSFSVTVNLNISGTAKADLGSVTSYRANTLILGGSNQASGTWGSTSSSATNTSNTWFLSPNTGRITISVSGCSNSTLATFSGTASICNGVSTNLAVAITGGSSPFTVLYTDGTSTYTLSSYTSGTSFSVTPVATKTYSLTSVTGTGGCIGTGLSGNPTVTVNNPSSAAVLALSGTSNVCTGSSTTFSVAITGGTSPYTVNFTDGATTFTVSNYTNGSAIFVSPTATKTYTLSSVKSTGGCIGTSLSGNPTVTVTPLPTANAGSATSSICQGSTSAALGGSVTSPATGGTWSDGGVGGTFNPNATTLNATYTASLSAPTTVTLTLTTSGGSCGTATASKTISVTPLITPALSLDITTGTNPACSNDDIEFTATPSNTGGGTVTYAFYVNGGSPVQSSSLATYLTSSLANGNVVTCTMTVTGGTCLSTTVATDAPITMTVNPLPQGSLTANGPFCTSGTAQLTFTKTAGTAPFSIDYDEQQVLDQNEPAATSGGAFSAFTNPIATTTTYTLIAVTDANGCSRTTGFTGASATVTITPLPVATFSYTANPYCSNASNPSPTFSGGGVAGTFSVTPTGLNFLSTATGQVNLVTSAAGTYTVTNLIAAAGGCAVVTAKSTITITTLPIATFSYTSSPYCSNSSNPSPTFSGGGAAGTFSSSPVGLNFISTSTGQVNMATSAAGTYTITNTRTAAGGCGIVTATSTITITTLPVTTFSYAGTPYCTTASNPSPTFSGGGVAGTFTSTAGGLSINSSSGLVTLSSSTAGTYTVTNTKAAAGGCSVVSSTSTITVKAPPTTANAGSNQTICVSGGTLAANSPSVGTGTWSVASGPSLLSSQFSNTVSPTAIFTPAGGAGIYNLLWSISNSPCTASTSTVTITVVSTGTWFGLTSDWYSAGNWCGGVPTSSTNVTIPSTVGTMPIISTSGAVCNNITINSGATLTLNGSATLVVSGSWSNSGTVTNTAGTITFTATSGKTIAGNLTGSSKFNNITFNGVGGAWTFSNDAEVGNNFTITNGTVTAPTTTLTVTGNWTNNGTFTNNSGTVDFNGSSSQSYSGTTTFNNLTISNSAGVNALSDLTVNGDLDLAVNNPSSSQGSLNLVTSWGTYPLLDDYASSTLFMGTSASTTGLGDVTGVVRRNTIVANTSYSFGNQYTTVSLTSGTMPTSLTLVIRIGVAPPGKLDAVTRHYQILPPGASGCFVTANFHYLDSELNGNTEGNLTTWDYDTGGGASIPDEHGRASYDFTNNYIGLANIPIGYFLQSWRTTFTLGNFQVGYSTWTGNTSSDWNNSFNWDPFGAPSYLSNIIIPDASGTNHDPVLPTGRTTINTMEIQTGGVLVMGSDTLIVSNVLSGGWEDQNTLGNDPGTSTVIFAHSGASISGTARFYNLNIADTATITLEAGGTMKIGNIVSRTGSGTGQWFADVFDGTVEYNGASQTILQTNALPNYHNLILSGSGTKTLPSLDLAIDGSLTLSGTTTVTATNALLIDDHLTIGSGTSFVAGSATHTIGGNIINNGTFTSGGGQVSLVGTISQSITGATTFGKLIVDNASGVTLNNDVTVDSLLDIENGIVTTGSNKVIVETNAVAYGINGFVNGTMKQHVPVGFGVSLSYPIGSGSTYAPIDLSIDSVVTSGYLTISTTGTDHPNIGTSGFNTSKTVNRYWTITNNGVALDGTFNTYSAGLQYDNTDKDGTLNETYAGAKLYSGSWISLDNTYNFGNYEYITGITGFGSFQIGQINPAPSLYSISPTSGAKGTTLNVTFNGDGFIDGISTITTMSGITTNSITVTDANTLIANITITGSASIGTYTVAITNGTPGGGMSDAMNFDVTATLPTANFSANSTTICSSGGLITFTDASTNASSWSWNFGLGAVPATGIGVGPFSVTYTMSGVKTVSLTTTNANGSTTKTRVNYISVSSSPPATISAITGPTIVCNTTPVSYTLTPVNGAISYVWNVPAGASILSGLGSTSISASFSSTFTGGALSAYGVSACGNGGAKTIHIYRTPFIPATISGPTSLCNSGTVSYSCSSVSTPGVTYFWTVPAGMSITSGNGTTSIIASVSPNTPITGNITVSASNSCTSSAPKLYPVNSSPILPLGSIWGPTNVCSAISFTTATTYTIANVSGITDYHWKVPAGASILSGDGTTSVSIQFNNSYGTSGAISVYGSNTCSNTITKTLTVYKVPAAPVSIAGPANVCGLTSTTYTVASVEGATYYKWTVPAGMTISSPQGTTSIDVLIGTVSPGLVFVLPKNECGSNSNGKYMTVAGCAAMIAVNDTAEIKKDMGFTIYPNPTKGDFTIEFTSDLDKTIIIKVYDILGNKVIDKKQSCRSGVTSIISNIENYNNGIYFVRIEAMNNDLIYSQKIIKQ